MNFDLDPELVALREVARKFANEVIKPNARKWDEQSDIPPEVYRQLGELGFMGLLIPADLGGSELGYRGATTIIEETARHCGGTALMLCAHNGLCCGHIMIGGSDEQKRRYLPRLASGEWIGAWGLTEAKCGSDAVAMETMARLDGNEWVINGNKMFITNGGKADVFVIMAVTEPTGAVAKNRISAFIVERGTKGLIIGAKEDKLGVRASNTVALTFDEMRIPKENMCGEQGQGYKHALMVLERGRISIGALAVGLGRGAVEEALTYAQQRVTFGKPLIEHQAISFMLADMATRVEGARLMVRKAAWLQDTVGQSRLEACIAKLQASEIATQVGLDAIQILGGYGYIKEFPVERYMRDAKLMEIGEGSSQVQRMLIARSLLEAN
ncbi:MAG: Acyl-CoA dehydrogenase [Phycisphaerae bacterium]|nr:Acyl-CoA dehydrogenase [Phycisphaerae bacterium]